MGAGDYISMVVNALGLQVHHIHGVSGYRLNLMRYSTGISSQRIHEEEEMVA